MLKIIVCEDNLKQRKLTENIINTHMAAKGIEGRIVYSSDKPNEVLEYVNNNVGGKGNVYFLDVDLKEDINGLMLGKKIREKDVEGYIIYITAHTELSMITFQYKLQALDYISKCSPELLKEYICNCLNVINEEQNKKQLSDNNSKKITVKSGSRYITKNVEDIVFIETSPKEHMLVLHTKTDRIEFYGTFKKIRDELNSDCFYQCHKSYVINTAHIMEINVKEKSIKMSNGKECFISSKYMKGLKQYV